MPVRAWSGRTAVGVLLVAAALLALLSEILVGSIEPFITRSACPSCSWA